MNTATAPGLRLLLAIHPVRTLPVALSAGYLRAPAQGMVLTASMQLEAAALKDSVSAETRKAEIDVLGVALNDRGSITSFKQTLSVPAASLTEGGRQAIVWGQQLPLRPGLYQVRVAVRDRQSGRTGSAAQWVEIPRVTPENFSMSSIFIGERKAGDAATSPKVPVSASRRLSRGSRLRYQTYFYNAAGRVKASDIVIRVQVSRDGQPVLTLPQTKLALDGRTDPAPRAYSGEIALEQLPTGRYILHISAAEQESRKSISQQTDFIVE